MIGRHRLRFEILHDPGNEVAARFGLRHVLPEYLRTTYLALGIDLAASNGDESWSLPLPARYVIDTGRVVRGANVSPDYRSRPEPIETVDILRQLRA